MQKIVNTKAAPAPIGPYNQEVQAGGFLFVSGQIALDPVSGRLIEGDAAAEAAQVLNDIGAILQAAGANFGKVVKTTIFLKDMNDFGLVNEEIAKKFTHTLSTKTN